MVKHRWHVHSLGPTGLTKAKRQRENPGSPGFVLCVQRSLRGLLVWDDLDVIVPLIVWQHDGNAINKRLVLQSDGGAALVGPDRANAGPDFLAALVFARGLAVVDDVRRYVGHMLSV